MRFLLALLLAGGIAAPLAAQQWDSPEALALVRRAVAERQQMQADSTLQSYHTVAHGFVFFLGQVGEDLSEPPRLIRADELRVEVYWKPPDQSKQIILGWRDGTWLPTDIEYHRDHLGIVTNNFGDSIRLGEGDEVRDVPHPLSPAGLRTYQFALRDSLSIRAPSGQVKVKEVQVRPRRFGEPAVIGSLYIDAATAELVRFRFSFTPSAYLDRQLEDISVVLENSLWDGRYWLPYRQEIEIRRRMTWLDFPVRGIIRGRWEIQDYDINVAIPDSVFQGPAIAGLRDPVTPDSAFGQPLEAAIGDVARPLSEQDMASLRGEVERIAGTHGLGGLPAERLAIGSVSDLVHVNRVQGLAFGFGGVIGWRGTRIQLRPRLEYGTADERLLGRVDLRANLGATRLEVSAARQIRDFGEVPVITPVINSFLAQELGHDFGDYVLLESVGVGLRHKVTARTAFHAGVAVEESRSVTVQATPATGDYRPNPPLGAGTYRIARLGLEHVGGGVAAEQVFQGSVMFEAGEGPTEYLRATARGEWTAALGGSALLARGFVGVGSDGMPAYRAFAIGGRSTLVSEPFRAYGGRQAALGHLEWRFEAPVPAIPLGSFASTGRRMIVAPFVAAGWTNEPAAVGTETDGVRPVVGVAFEWFMRLIRLEAGVGLRDGRVGITVDVNREWWGVL